jgi:photosystem II stability/assembly factor-like uncharacterized protein
MNFNPLPEEQENSELVRSLRETYRMSREDRESLARIQARLFQAERAQQQPIQHIAQPHYPEEHATETMATDQYGKFRFVSRSPLRTNRPWYQNLSMIAAVLLILLATGASIATFLLHDRSHSPASSPNAAGARKMIGSCNGLNNLGIYMFTEQVGWANGPENTAPHGRLSSLFHTNDGGKSWQQVIPTEIRTTEIDDSIFVCDENMALLLPRVQSDFFPYPRQASYYYRTVDAGATWQRLNWPVSQEDNRPETGHMPTFLDHVHGWVVTGTSAIGAGLTYTIFRTDDGGKNWQQVGQFKGSIENLQFSDKRTGWLTTVRISSNNDLYRQLYVSRDGGRSWNEFALPGSQGLGSPTGFDLTFFTGGEGYLFATFETKNSAGTVYLYSTRNGGNS